MRIVEKNSKRQFWAMFSVPFVLSQWMPFSIEFKGSPEVKVQGTELSIKTEDASGGFAYFFEKPISLTDEIVELKWNWKINEFPSVAPTPPFKKSSEDFALRVGMLISDGKSRIPLPGKMKREIKKRGLPLSYVLFYCASSSNQQACGRSPFHRNVVNCLRPASNTSSAIKVDPLADAKRHFKLDSRRSKDLKVFGIWLFADSDNSESASFASVRDLQVKSTQIGRDKRRPANVRDAKAR